MATLRPSPKPRRIPWFKRFIRQESMTREQIAARDEMLAARRLGTTPIGQVEPRQRVRVSGNLRSLTYLPKTRSPAVIGALYDGTGAINLVWMGAWEIPGIKAGKHLVASGIVVEDHGRPCIFNPEYEILSSED